MFALGAEDTAHVTATRGSRPRVCSVGVFAAVVLVILAAAGGLAQPAAAADCKPYIFIGARGSGQPDGFGDVVGATKMRLETLAAGSDLVESIPLGKDDGYRAVPVYTDADLDALRRAALTGTVVGVAAIIGTERAKSYSSSVSDGKRALTSMLSRFAEDCPSSKFLLAGYSQGAHVVYDVLQDIAAPVRKRILTLAVFGDPRFNPDGSGTEGSFNPHRHGLLGQRLPFTGGVPTASWCIAGDIVCQGPPWVSVASWGAEWVDPGAHGRYVPDGYADLAGAWVWQRIRKDVAATGGPVPPAPTPTPRPFDLSLVVDTTGSMGGAIDSVRTNLQAIRDELAAKTTDFRLALSEYKDDGDPFQSQLDLDLTADADAFSAAVGSLSAGGGGDTPESVFSGLQTGLGAVSWRPEAAKAVVLVGDAPPKDPEPVTGLTEADIIAQALRVPAPIYALNVCCDTDAEAGFQRLADGTSGKRLAPDSGAAVADAILNAITEQAKAPVIGSPVGTAARARSAVARAATPELTGPVGTPLRFSAGTASSPLGEDLNYTWDFGDGTVINADSQTTVVSHTWSARFDGDVKLTATDEEGRTAQRLMSVSIHGDSVPALAGLAAPALTAGDRSITATWAPPTSGQPAYYELRRDGETVAAVGAEQPLRVELSDLDNGVPVSLSVVAYDAYGRSVDSPAATAIPGAASSGPSASSGTSTTPKPRTAPAGIVVWNRAGRRLTVTVSGRRPVGVGRGSASLLRAGGQTRVTVRIGGRAARLKVRVAAGTVTVLSASSHARRLKLDRVATAREGQLALLSNLPRAAVVSTAGRRSVLAAHRARIVTVAANAKLTVRYGKRQRSLRAPAVGSPGVMLLSRARDGALRATRLIASPTA